MITKKQIKKVGHFFKKDHILAGDLFFQQDLKDNNIEILHIPGIEVKHTYMTDIFGYMNKIQWAKKCKNIFGNTKILEAPSLSKASSIFSESKIFEIKKQYIKKINDIEVTFLEESTSELSTIKKIILKGIIYLTKSYLNK